VVTRSGDLSPAVQVDYTTQDGTAHAGVDYVATSGTLSFAPNQTTATISVPIIGNTVFGDGNRTFTVALSNATGSPIFANQVSYPTGTNPDAVAVGDFNGDGVLDLAVANEISGTVSILLGSSSKLGGFVAQQTFACGSTPRFVAVADFNGDGKPDLALLNSYPDETLTILLNTTPTGSNTLSFAPQSFPLSLFNTNGLAVTDINGDGKPDIAVSGVSLSRPAMRVLLNTTPPGSAVASFAVQFFNNVAGGPLAIADFNGDGIPDLVAVANGFAEGNMMVLLNTTPRDASTASFASPQFFSGSLGASGTGVLGVDLNGDGRPDLVHANRFYNTISVLLNTTPPGATTLSFTPYQDFVTGSDAYSMAAADFNGDGTPDLVVGNYGSNSVSVLLNTTASGSSTPSFASQQVFTVGTHPRDLAVADFNRDGRPDLVVANEGANSVSVLINTSISIVGSPATGTIQDDDAPASIAIAAGNNQSAVVNTLFATNLAVQVHNSNSNLVQGVSVTFTAPSSGPSGTFDGSYSVTVVSDASGQAIAPTFTANATAGNYMVTAQASGGANPSITFSLTNTAASRSNTTTVLTSSIDPSVFGQSLTLTATVAPASGSGTPTGTVTFLDDGVSIGSATLSNGSSTFVTSSLSVSAHTITASYSGDANFNASISAAITQTVNPANTTTSVVSSGPPTVSGQSVTFTATVTVNAPGSQSVANPTGTVTFYDGGIAIGTGTLSNTATDIATFTTSLLTTGGHTITAAYTSGDGNFNASPASTSITQTVTPANTTTSVESSGSPTVSGQSVTFTASVTVNSPGSQAVANPTGTVTFYDGGVAIGTGTLSGTPTDTAAFVTSTLSAGNHTITAAYTSGDGNFNTSPASASITQVVNKDATTVGLTSSPNPSAPRQAVTFTATVTANAPGGGIPTGTVTFKTTKTILGTVALDSTGHAQLTTSTLSVTTTVTAVYNGDANFLTNSGSVVQTVTPKTATSTSVASSLNPSTFGQSVTFTATVTHAGSGTPTGTVTFFDVKTRLGSATLNSNGTATFTTSTLSVGSHSITAFYGGDSNFASSTSPILTQTVNSGAGIVSMLSNSGPSLDTRWSGKSLVVTWPVAPAQSQADVKALVVTPAPGAISKLNSGQGSAKGTDLAAWSDRRALGAIVDRLFSLY
jgi:hypothetical protein